MIVSSKWLPFQPGHSFPSTLADAVVTLIAVLISALHEAHHEAALQVSVNAYPVQLEELESLVVSASTQV